MARVENEAAENSYCQLWIFFIPDNVFSETYDKFK